MGNIDDIVRMFKVVTVRTMFAILCASSCGCNRYSLSTKEDAIKSLYKAVEKRMLVLMLGF